MSPELLAPKLMSPKLNVPGTPGLEHERRLGAAMEWDCRAKALPQYRTGLGPAV